VGHTYIILAPDDVPGPLTRRNRMSLYESIFIVRPSLSDDDTNKLIDKMKGVLEKSGGTLLKHENWGKKKLAYEVKRERKGTFVYFYFKSPGNVVSELERSYRLEDSVLKFLTVRQDMVARKPAAEVKEA
jgi:small subunit ribosomal protein S6